MQFFEHDIKTNNKEICCLNEMQYSLMLHLFHKYLLCFFFPPNSNIYFVSCCARNHVHFARLIKA